MPEEAAGFCVVEGKEAAQVLRSSPAFGDHTDSKQRFQLSELVVGVIASPGGAVHPYRTVTSIFKNLLQRYPKQ